MEEIMKNDKTNNRRNFLKGAGALLVAAAVPGAIAAQKSDARPTTQNNLKQLIVFGGVAEPNPNLPGVFGMACFQFQMRADIGGSGFGTISDPVFTEINSQIKIHTARQDETYVYVFIGTMPASQSPELIGKTVTIKVQVLSGDNCNVSLTIGETPVQGLLLPAIQKVR
jgi:hypothetical protein